MANTYKRQWHYHVFDSCDEFETWQQSCSYEANIQSIQVMDQCECGSGTDQKVMVTWWEYPPGLCPHEGGSPSSNAGGEI